MRNSDKLAVYFAEKKRHMIVEKYEKSLFFSGDYMALSAMLKGKHYACCISCCLAYVHVYVVIVCSCTSTVA